MTNPTPTLAEDFDFLAENLNDEPAQVLDRIYQAHVALVEALRIAERVLCEHFASPDSKACRDAMGAMNKARTVLALVE